MIKPRVLLLCALKVRDLPILVILKSFLEKKGMVATILHAHCNVKLIKHFPCDLVVFPHLFSYEFSQLAKFKKKQGTIITSMCTEQLGQSDAHIKRNYEKTLNYWNLGDKHFLWGRGIERILKKIINKNKLAVVGCPKMDFYSKKFVNSLYDKNQICKKYGLNKDKKIITWATGYGWADIELDYAKKAFKESGQNEFMSPAKWVNTEKKARRRTLTAFFSEAKHFQDVQFIIKIHPCELTNQIYLQELEKYGLKNVKLVIDSELFELIFVSEAWLHWNSTTSIEAGILNKPSFNLELGVGDEFAFKQIVDCSVRVKTEKSLHNNLNAVLLGKNLMTKQMEKKRNLFVKKWFGPVDGCSIKRHADEIEKLLNNKREKLSIIERYNAAYLFFTFIVCLKQFFGLEMHESLVRFLTTSKRTPDKRRKFFSNKEVKQLEKKYEKIVKLFDKTKSVGDF